MHRAHRCLHVPLRAGLAALLCWLAVPELSTAQSGIVTELVTNGTFDSDLAGWELETLSNVNTAWSPQGNDAPGSFRGTQEEGGNQFTSYDLGRQCIPVEGGEFYQLRSAVRPRDDNEVDGFATVFVVWPDDGCAAEDRASSYVGFAGVRHSEPASISDWTGAQSRFQIPAGVTEVRLALSVTTLQLALGDKRYGAFFDDISFGKVPPDLVADIDFRGQTSAATQQVTFDVGFTNREQSGTARSIEATIQSEGVLRFVSETCPGDMVNTINGGVEQITWFNIPDQAPGDGVSCSVTAEVQPGFSGTIDTLLQVECTDCNLTPGANFDSDPLIIAPRADIAASISGQQFQSVEDTLRIDVQLENRGTKTWDRTVLINKPTDAVLTPGTCGTSAITVEDANFLSFPMSVPAGQSRGCSIGFDHPTPGEALTFRVVADSDPSTDYDDANNSAETTINTVSLRVNYALDFGDFDPGDGVCDTSSIIGQTCSLRAALEESNALAGFQVIPVPTGDYALTLAGGDQALAITDPVRIYGETPAAGLPRIFADWSNTSDASRIFEIDAPSAEVFLRDLHLQGQDILMAGDGGLIRSTGTLLNLSGLILEDGGANGFGGALFSDRRALLENVYVRSSRAPFGAGVAFRSTGQSELFSIIQSRIHDNSSPALASQSRGGGVYVDDAMLEVYKSSIDNNASVKGGGIALIDAHATIENSTLSTNDAFTSFSVIGQGGAIWLKTSDAEINFATVAYNAADRGDDSEGEGGALYVSPDSLVTVGNSLFFGSEAQTRNVGSMIVIRYPDGSSCFGSMTSLGYNTIIPSVVTDNQCDLSGGTNDNFTRVPSLAALAPTGPMDVPFHDLNSSFDEIDGANPTCERLYGAPLRADQRSLSRPLDGDGDGDSACDRGAVESDGELPAIALTCPAQATLQSGGFTTIECTVEAFNDAGGDVFFSCQGAPPSCDFVPEPLTLATNGSGVVDVIISGNAADTQKIITVQAVLSPSLASADVAVTTLNIPAPPPVMTISASVTGNGTVESSPAGISCGISCTADFAESLGSVDLTATPAPGWTFDRWTGACAALSENLASGASRCTLPTDTDQTTRAIFVEEITVTLDVTITGNGRVTSSPTGIDCTQSCSATFPMGSGNVTLGATADPGRLFLGWSGACTGTGGCTVSSSGNQTVEARFGEASRPGGDLVFRTGFE